MAKQATCKECGRMNLRISWSSLRTWETCRQRHFLYTKGKRATLADQRVFFPGTVTDRVVRDWLLNDPDKNPGLMPQMVADIMKREADLIHAGGGKMAWRDAGDRDQVLKDCIEAVTKIEPALNKYVLPYEYDVDFRFKAPVLAPHPGGGMETVILNGAMDIIVRDDQSRYYVWDVKHTRDDYYWKKTKGQLSFYDLCVQIMFGTETRITGLLQPLCKEQIKPFPLTLDDRSQLMQRVLNMANNIWLEDFTPRTDFTECMYCNVKHACSKFQPVQDGKNKRMSLLGS